MPKSFFERADEQRNAIVEDPNRFFLHAADLFCIAGFDGHFKLLNPAWEKTLGFTSEELFVKPYVEFVHPDDRDETVREMRKLANGASAGSFTNRYVCKNGSHKWLLWNATSVPGQREIYAVAREISELKNYLEQVEHRNRELDRRNREVELSVRLRSRFLATMGYELRTPLTAIIGFSDLLDSNGDAPLGEKPKRHVEQVQKAAQDLLKLIDDILDISKLEAGQLEWRLENFPVAPAVAEVLSSITPLAAAKSIQLENVVPPDLLAYADRGRFQQILNKLLSNAVKFTPEAGRVRLKSSAEGGFVRVSVSDTGVGIPPDEQKVIFEPFRQTKDATWGVKDGTGLGLPITKRLVEEQGGKIWVESTASEGTRFNFTLPIGQAAPEPGPEEVEESVRLS